MSPARFQSNSLETNIQLFQTSPSCLNQSDKPVSDRLHELYDVVPRAREDLPSHVGLHADDPDVHLVPGNGLQHSHLRPLDIETEVVDCRVTQGQQEGVERDALDPSRVVRRLGNQS